jgi:hypothetical protein
MTLALVGVLSGCTVDKSAENLADQYYQSVQNKDYNQALNYFSQSFFDNVSQADWIQILQNMNNKLGDLKSYKLNSWNKTSFVGVGSVRSTTTYTLQYKVTYTNETDTETLTLNQLSGGQLQITHFTSNSMTLLK